MPSKCSACQGHGQLHIQKLEQRHNATDPRNPIVEAVVMVEDCTVCGGRGEVESREDMDRSEVEREENHRRRAPPMDEDADADADE